MRLFATVALVTIGCSDETTPPVSSDSAQVTAALECVIPDGEDPDFALSLGCADDFDVLSSLPIEASIPGARSTKTVLDQLDNDTLYFQNSKRYPIHWEFASAHLGIDNGKPPVPDLSTFNLIEYFSPDRRFLLGAVSHYEGPDKWVYEIAPYDTANAEQVTQAFEAIRDRMWNGDQLLFHPTSDGVVQDLPPSVPVITTDELFDGIDYQPLNLGSGFGQLAFRTADSLAEAFLNPCEITVLDEVPNDISIVGGIITEAFQTPLAHINVLSQNRGTPNMALRGAFNDAELRALEGAWVELTVGPFEHTVTEVSAEVGQAACDERRPPPLSIGDMDLSVTTLTDADVLLDPEVGDLGAQLDHAIPAFGGKASHYGGLTQIEAIAPGKVPVPKAFVIPVYFYDQFMSQNGFYERLEALLSDPEFLADASLRADELAILQDDMRAVEIAPGDYDGLLGAVTTKILAEHSDYTRMRFRSSTTAEDLGSFTGAGLYQSKSGNPNDANLPVDEAIKTVWASVWGARAYEERAWYGIDQIKVGMAVLVHRSFPEEEANGVAITNNIFDTSGVGVQPAFYINTQVGDNSVVIPDPGVITDQYLHYYTFPGQPITYLAHSNLIAPDQTVLSLEQSRVLADALDEIHRFFLPVYGAQGGFYAMDTEFKFDQVEPDGTEPVLFMKQARPYPGWNVALYTQPE